MTLTPILSIAAALMLGACGKPSGTVTETGTKTTASAPAAQTPGPAQQPAATTANRDTMPPTDVVQDTTAKEGNDPTGGYFLSGDVPKDLGWVDHLGLATIDENAKPAPLNGFIRPKNLEAKDFKLVDPKIEGTKLTFTTIELGGVSYSFTGEFTRLGNFPANPPASDEVVLKGTLTTMKRGTMVAERPVAFTYSAGG